MAFCVEVCLVEKYVIISICLALSKTLARMERIPVDRFNGVGWKSREPYRLLQCIGACWYVCFMLPINISAVTYLHRFRACISDNDELPLLTSYNKG